MSILVLDASAIVEYVLRTASGRRYEPLIEARGTRLHAPAVCDVEVVSGLRRLLLRGAVSDGRAGQALGIHLGLKVIRHGHRPLLRRALALRDNFTASDATYVALAEALGAPLLTADRRLARAVRAHSGVELAV